MFSLRKTDHLLFDGGESALENEWLYKSYSGEEIPVSVNRIMEQPLSLLEQHFSETDFKGLVTGLNAQKGEGISGNYCNQQGVELYWLKSGQLLVIVSFGEVNAGRYRLVAEGEIE
ncbi:MAG TPA: hypothetical protein VK151_14440 [Fluviicola sp.]|nr:hypothetical protein [Fluviicola sp.]